MHGAIVLKYLTIVKYRHIVITYFLITSMLVQFEFHCTSSTETCSLVELQARTAPCRPLLCIFQKCNFDIWTTGCISLYCLTDAEVGPLRLCFCSVSGTLEFSRLLLSSGPLDSWILDAAQYQQLYKMIISLIFMEQFFSCHSLSLE